MIYAFRFCQAQQWQCDVSEYTLPSSLFSSVLSLHRAPLRLSRSVRSLPIPTRVSRSLLAFHLALRHSHSGISSSSGRFLAVAVRPCNAAGTTVEPCPPSPPPPHPPSCPVVDTAARRCHAAVAAPLQLQQQRTRPWRQQRPTHTIAAAAR